MYKAWICRIELQTLKIIINEKYNNLKNEPKTNSELHVRTYRRLHRVLPDWICHHDEQLHDPILFKSLLKILFKLF